MSAEKISILIADDHKLIRETWTFILNSDARFKVIAECSNGDDAIEIAKAQRPNIVLMDINMSPTTGIEATQQIRKVSPATKIIGVSMHSQPAYAKKMLSIGARGYVTKNSSREEMIKAILEVHGGNKYICDEVKNIISEQLLEENQAPSINLLSEREIQIIRLIKQGSSSKEISTELNISLKTVEVHRHNILKKLNLKNTASLVNFINNSAIDLV
ncbi:response regulator transcription factor [Parasegetibacter sp. NRK P23]|uniref:response regulator n=1 Tax=Parasegetibacter sp. NRK P23 TaxID=2942999 RepID=UPI002044900E|nr:response regulator transcription factor [Parasegetibacter sp. NRK P23]MCM5527852.1 response regulator transcription factor [Parasegetibacter sp. NRK P23]